MSLNDAIEQRFGLPTETGNTVGSNALLEQLFGRKSYRTFSKKPIDDDLMQTLLEASMSAPSKSDLQQARVIWVDDPALKQSIANLSPELQHWIADAPGFLVWCGDNTVLRASSEQHIGEFRNDHLDQYHNCVGDAAIAMTAFMIAAESKGLGCCPVSSIRNTPYELTDLLQLPQHTFPFAGLVVGYPEDDADVPISLRLPPSVTIMKNGYRQDTQALFEEIADYSKRRQEVQPLPERPIETSIPFSEDYGWIRDKALQYALLKRPDWGEYIKKQGFNLG